MRHTQWTLEPGRARLELDAFSALVDLHSPRPGLEQMRIGEREFPSARVLAIDLASVSGLGEGAASFGRSPAVDSSPEESVAARIQAGDLIVTYEETARRPLRIQASWRAGWTADFPGVFGVDLDISVQTSQWKGHPRLNVFSLLGASESFAWSNLSLGHTFPSQSLGTRKKHVTLENLFTTLEQQETRALNLILRTDTRGSAEAIKHGSRLNAERQSAKVLYTPYKPQ